MRHNNLFVEFRVAIELQTGPMYVFVVTSAELLSAEGVLTGSLDDTSWSTPTTAKFFSFEEVISGNQQVLTFTKISELSLGP